MKNAVFWDIKTQFVPHRRHNTSPLQSLAGLCCERFEVARTLTMKNSFYGDVAPCGSCENRRLGGKYRFHRQGGNNQRANFTRSVFELLFTVNVVFSSLILFMLMMRRYLSPKRRFLEEPHGATFQKVSFFNNVHGYIIHIFVRFVPLLWSSCQNSWQYTQRSRVRFPTL
jgi:hypothetical protein